MGRDYTPTFWNQTIFDAFGTNGLGSSLNVRQLYGGTRQDNSIGYFLPANPRRLLWTVMASANEGATSLDRRAAMSVAASASLRVLLTSRSLPANCASAQPILPTVVASGAIPAGTVSAVAGAEDGARNLERRRSWDFGFFKLLGLLQRGQASQRKGEDGVGQRCDPIRPS
jgi:hypothetical protein